MMIRGLLGTLLLAMASLAPASADSLAHIADRLAKGSTIAHVEAHDVVPMLDRNDIVLFDVREPKEYAVSRLPGAIRVNPAMEPEAFLVQYADRIDGKYALFYCSVGRRSTQLAEAVQDAGSPAYEIANLRGGIFRWHGLKLPLENDQGATDQAHPYNWFWRQVMPRADRSAYKPSAEGS